MEDLQDEIYNIPLGLSVGDKFNSLENVAKTISEVTKSNFVQMFRRDSRTIEAARRKVKRYLNDDLKFYQIRYACIRGGQKYSCKGKGLRNKRTFRKESLCPAHVVFTVANSGNEFEITSLNNVHNHQVAEVLYNQLPHNRRLPDDIKQETLKLLRLKANKHMIRNEIATKTNKCLTLKDLSNLRQGDKVQFSNNIKAACDKINLKYGADCHLLVDSEHNFKGLMFCTKHMVAAMEAYPELICFDATYKLLQIRAPVYIILVEDGNGESQIVAVGILVNEDEESVQWFLESFKNLNPAWPRIKNIMADKDLNERQLLKKCFPEAQIHICIFHVFKIFQREITCEKMKITAAQKNLALEYLQKLVYSKCESEFEKIKLLMEKNLSHSIINYFNEHWLSIKEEWCPRLGFKVCNFLNTTNNRLEGLNSKLKAVISKHSTLDEFLDHLFVTIDSLEAEKDNRVANFMNKERTSRFLPDQVEGKFQKVLTEYAFKKILPQISELNKVKCTTSDNQVFVTSTTKDVQYQTTCTSCTCYFFTSMSLPCKHIFKVCQQSNQDLFNADLIHKRWTIKYFLSNQRLFLKTSNHTDQSRGTVLSVAPEKYKKSLTQQEKYKRLLLKCKVIASLSSETCGNTYENITAFLDDVINTINLGQFDLLKINACHENNLNHQDIGELDNNTNQNDIADNENHDFNYQKISELDNNINQDEITDCENTDLYHEELSELEGNTDQNQIIICYEHLGLNHQEISASENSNTYQNEIITHYENCDFDHQDTSEVEENVDQGKITSLENSDKILQEIDGLKNNTEQEEIITYENPDENLHLNYGVSELEENIDPDAITSQLEINELVNVNTEKDTIDLKTIKIAPILKRKGRPRGSDLTVIGLPKKRKKLDVPFVKKAKSEKQNILFTFVLKNANDAYTKKTLNIDDLRTEAEIDNRIAYANLAPIKPFFTNECFNFLKTMKQKKKTTSNWNCPICDINLLPDDASIECSFCLNWFHITCANINSSKLPNLFKCTKCNANF